MKRGGKIGGGGIGKGEYIYKFVEMRIILLFGQHCKGFFIKILIMTVQFEKRGLNGTVRLNGQQGKEKVKGKKPFLRKHHQYAH